MKSKTVHIQTAVLIPFREFNRLEYPTPQISCLPATTVYRLAKDIEQRGMLETLCMIVCMDDRNGIPIAILNDGNNRLAAAILLGIEQLMVEVFFMTSAEIATDIHNGDFKEAAYNRMKKQPVSFELLLNLVGIA